MTDPHDRARPAALCITIVTAWCAFFSAIPACSMSGPVTEPTIAAPISRGQSAVVQAKPIRNAPAAVQTSPAPTATPQPPAGLREVFPHVRADLRAKYVEVDAEVPIDAHDEQTPRIFLEVVACTRSTLEHEALLVTDAQAAHVHAALLLIGLENGSTGLVWWDKESGTQRKAPTGPRLKVELRYADAQGKAKTASPAEWVVDARSGELLNAGGRAGEGWVFAGSAVRPAIDADGNRAPRYSADLGGTFIGLATFGTECIAYSRPFSAESAVDEPVWIANAKAMPKVGSKVVIVLRAE